jgi:hypothetical protein
VLRELTNVVGALDAADVRFKGKLFRLEYRLGIGPGAWRLNRQLVASAQTLRPDLAWIDSGRFVTRATVRAIKKTGARVVYLNPDDPFGQYRSGWRIFLHALPEYDLHFVSREQNVSEYQRCGAREVHLYDRSFDPRWHRPVQLDAADHERFRSPVGFVGSGTEARAETFAWLSDHGIPVAIWGNGYTETKAWPRIRHLYRGQHVLGDDYAKAICGLDIALHFLRTENRDEQDSRTFEIPACGVFMLAERSQTHERLFVDGKEAVFFDSREECLEKTKFYLAHPEARRRIAEAGHGRVTRSGYDHESRLRGMLDLVRQRLDFAHPEPGDPTCT